jgi:hypothetical protein
MAGERSLREENIGRLECIDDRVMLLVGAPPDWPGY